MSNYRLNIDKRNGKYFIERKIKHFYIIPGWQVMSSWTGALGYSGRIPIYFDKKEDAINRVIELTKEDEIRTIENEEIQKKFEKFTPIEISSDDIKEKFPQYFL